MFMNRNGKSRPLKKRPSTISGVTKPTFVTACQPLTGMQAGLHIKVDVVQCYNTKEVCFRVVVEDLISCTSVILSHQNNAEFLIIFFVSGAVFWSWPSFSECLVLISVIIMAGVVFTVHDSRT